MTAWGTGSPPSGTGGAAQPAAARRRPVRWGKVVGGIAVILCVAVPCLLGVIAVSLLGNYYQRTHSVADGRAPGTLTFTTEDKRYVIALSDVPDGIFDGMTRQERRAEARIFDGEASSARCTITHPDGSTTSVRGDRQGTSTTVGTVYATVGEFDGKPGETRVECSFDPAEDRLGNSTQTPLMVHEAGSWLKYGLFALIAGLLASAGAGVLLILWGTVWRGTAPARP